MYVNKLCTFRHSINNYYMYIFKSIIIEYYLGLEFTAGTEIS